MSTETIRTGCTVTCAALVKHCTVDQVAETLELISVTQDAGSGSEKDGNLGERIYVISELLGLGDCGFNAFWVILDSIHIHRMLTLELPEPRLATMYYEMYRDSVTFDRFYRTSLTELFKGAIRWDGYTSHKPDYCIVIPKIFTVGTVSFAITDMGGLDIFIKGIEHFLFGVSHKAKNKFLEIGLGGFHPVSAIEEIFELMYTEEYKAGE